MRQYAGFGTAEESNRRYRYLFEQGQTGLSVAFDLPTQMGRDADHPLASGEVGRVGVSICSLADMETLLDGLPLDKISTSMTINATASILLALYLVVAERRGVRWDQGQRHDPERHPEGIHRARHLYLSAARLDADHHRHLQLRERRKCRTGTRFRSPATTSARPARPPRRSWHSRSPTASRTWKRRSRRASRSTLREPPFVLLQRAQQLLRGDREVPRRAPAVGAYHERALRTRRTNAR